MATKNSNLSGIVKFCRLQTPDKEYNKYSLSLYMTAGSFAKFSKLGLDLTVREDTKSGEKYVIFRRNPDDLDFNKNPIGRPIVLMANGNSIPDNDVPDGSRVTISIQAYDTKKGKGHRLNAVIVHELAEKTASSKFEGAYEYYE